MRQIQQDFERVDILVSIAGITSRIPTDEIPPDTVRRLMEVNYFGMFGMCQEVGKIMLAQGGGKVELVLSNFERIEFFAQSFLLRLGRVCSATISP